MRYGVISDVHGNLEALRAVVHRMKRFGVDGWICAGDVVGYGPRPNECVDLVLDLGASVVAGNHELIAIGALPGRSPSSFVSGSHGRTRDVLRDDVLAELERWPRRIDLGGIVVAHGSLSDAEHYTSTETRCHAQLEQLAREHPEARVLVLGHTHEQRLFVEGEGYVPGWHGGREADLPAGPRVLLNPGSVGQSRSWRVPPRAHAAVLDVDAGRAVPVRVGYDLRTTVADLRRHSLSYRTIHNPPLRNPTVRRVARRLEAALSRPHGAPKQ